MEAAQTPQPQAPRARAPKRGFPLFAFLIVLVIVVIAVVALRVQHQRRGGRWASAGSSPGQAVPHCLWPGDAAHVAGRVDIYPGIAAITSPCASLPVGGGPGSQELATDVVARLDSEMASLSQACGVPAGVLSFAGAGQYVCRPKTGGTGPARASGGPGPLTVPVNGAAHKLGVIFRGARCHPGHLPLFTGRVDFYGGASSRVPSDSLELSGFAPTIAALHRLEAGAAQGTGVRPGWYVVTGEGRCPAAGREGFSWGEWTGFYERDNFAEGYDQRRRRLSGGHSASQASRRHGGFQAYRMANPFGGYDAVNPKGKHDLYEPAYESFIDGAIPCGGCTGNGQGCGCGCPPPPPSVESFHSSAQEDADTEELKELNMIGKYGVYEGFSPDKPGSCAQKQNRAAAAEIDALRVAVGM